MGSEVASSVLVSQLTPFLTLVQKALDPKELKKDILRNGVPGKTITVGLCKPSGDTVLGFLEHNYVNTEMVRGWKARDITGISYGYVKDEDAWYAVLDHTFSSSHFNWEEKPLPSMGGLPLKSCFKKFFESVTEDGCWTAHHYTSHKEALPWFTEISKGCKTLTPHEVVTVPIGTIEVFVSSVFSFIYNPTIG